MLFSTSFTAKCQLVSAKCQLVFVLTQETLLLRGFILNPGERPWVPLTTGTSDF